MDSKDDASQPSTSKSSLPPFSSLTASRSRAAVIPLYNPQLQEYTSSYQPQLSAPLGFDVGTSNTEHPQLTNYHHQVFFDGQGPYYNQHFASGLVHPPVPDMSLGLPYSSDQPVYLTGPHHSVDLLNPGGTDHLPQIPLSQIESFLSAAEQKPLPEFTHAQPQHWENSYRSSTSDHPTSLANFSPFYSKSSETLTDALDIITSIGQSKTNVPFEDEFYSPKNSVGFNMLAEFSSYVGSNNTSSSGVHSDNPNYHFTSDTRETLLKSTDFNAFGQNGHDGSGNQDILGYTNFRPSTCVNDQRTSNSGSKCKKKKKSSNQLDNVNISGNSKIKKKRAKKCNAPDLGNPEKIESTSPGPCLSPTFIASLSSKRADSFNRTDHPSPFNGVKPRSNVAATINHSMPADKSNNQTSQVPNGVHGSFQQVHSKETSQNASLASHFNSKMARGPQQVNSEHKYSTALTVEVREENKSPSPYQFSPEFLASLSSKKVEITPQSSSSSSVKCQYNPSMPLQSFKGRNDNTFQAADEKSLTFHCSDSSEKSPSPNPISPGFLASLSSKRVKPSVKKQCSAPNQNIPDLYLPNNHMQEKVILQGPFEMTVGSPKPYRSPPVYNAGSGFQYPTPPMEEEDVKGPSPGQGLSPPLLPSSYHGATNSSGQCLSPTFDDALPTPPNSAGPKPSDALSKEEQTSRILEIIAREREKVANAPPVPLQESKKKKKKKRLKEVGGSNSPLLSANPEPYGGEMNFQFYPKFSVMASSGCLSSPNDSNPRNFAHNTFQGSDKLGSGGVLNYENRRQDFSQGENYLAVSVNQEDKNGHPVSNSLNPINSQHQMIHLQQQLHNSQHGYVHQQADNSRQHVNGFQLQTNTNQQCEKDNRQHADHSRQQTNNNRRHFDDGQHQNNRQHANNNQQKIDHSQQHCSNNQQEIDRSQQHCSNNQPKIDHSQQHCSNNQQVNNNRSEALHSHCDTSKTTSVPISSQAGPNHYQQSFCKTTSNYSMDHLLSKRPSLGTTDQGLRPLCEKDPYAFDEPEQGLDHIQLKKDKIVPPRRQPVTVSSEPSNTAMKRGAVNLLKMEKPLSGPSATSQVFLTSFPEDKVALSPSTSPTNHLHCNSSQPSKTVAPGMYVKAEPQQMYRNRVQSLADDLQNQVLSKLSNRTENKSLNDSTHHSSLKSEKLTYDPALSFVKQEVLDVSQSGGQSLFSSQSSHYCIQNVKKCEVKTESDSALSSKKKRGRPSKFMDSETSPDVKPKAIKHKLQEKKTNISPTSKLQYRINGVSARPDDLKLDQNLVDRLANNLMEVADCSCLSPDHIPSESLEGPYYTQLGAARDIPAVRKIMEHRTGVSGAALRIEKVIFTGKEGKSKEGCPVAKWIIRRSGPEEKYLCIVRKRPGHFCDTAVIIVVIVAWEGVVAQQADSLYDFLITTLPKSGLETDRRCGLNEKKTCACQGVDLLRRGASFSFGCSWSMYYNGCKFARSQTARKFKLKDIVLEDVLSEKLEKLATDISPLYGQLAPDAFRNQTQFESQAGECRLGSRPGRPFSGVTAVVDFCCHSHRDCHNMNNGSTVVVNLTKHRGFEKPDDEQYHVLPLYILDQTDESGSMEGQMEKVRKGSLEVLSRYMTQVRMRSTPYRPCQRNRTTPKKQSLKKGAKKPRLVKAVSFPPVNYEGGESPGSECCNDGFCSPQFVPPDKPSPNDNSPTPGVGIEDRNQESMSYTDLMAHQGTPGFNDLYTKFWDYFYTHGVFPPRKWTIDNTDPTSLTVVKSVNLSAQGRPSTVIQPSSADLMFLHQQQQQLNQQRARQLQQLNEPGARQQQQLNQPVARQQQQQDVLQTSDWQQLQHRQQVSSHSPQRPSLPPPSPHPPQGHQRPPLAPPSSPRQQNQVSRACHLISQTSLAEPHQVPCLSQAQQQASQHHSIFHVQHRAYHNQHPSSLSHVGDSHLQANSQNLILPQHISNASSSGPQHTSSSRPQHASSSGPLHTTTSSGPQHISSSGPQHTSSSGPQHTSSGAQHTSLLGPQYRSSSGPQHTSSLGPQHTSSLGAQHTSSSGPQYNSSSGPQHTSSLGSQHLLNHGPPLPCNENKLFFHFENQQRSHTSNSSPEDGSHFIGQVSAADPVTRPPPPYSQAVVQSQDMQIKSQVASSQVPQCPPPSYTDSIAFGLPNHNVSGQAICGPTSGPGPIHPHSLTFCQSSPRPDGLTVTHLVDNGNHNANITGHQGYNSLLERQTMHSVSSQEGPSVPHGAHSNSLPSPESARTAVSTPAAHSGTVDVHSKFWPDSLTGQMEPMNRPSSRMDDTMRSPDDPIPAVGRCWSRMSEPLRETENNRPFSRMSEPDLAHIGKPELNHYLHKKMHNVSDPTLQFFNLIDSDSSNHSFRQSQVDKVSRPVASIPRNMEMFASHEPMEQSANLPSATFRPSAHSGLQYHTAPDQNEVCAQNKIINTLMGQKARFSNPTLVGPSAQLTCPRMTSLNDRDTVLGPSQGNIYPNGPLPGEKVKIHKSEGFVVPTLGQGPREPPYQVIDSTIVSVETDDNREVFEDPAMGGVAIALCHGAVLFEVAKRELHATTALKEPNRYQPKRISLVFYQHKNLNLARHGFEEYERKTEERRSLAEQARLIEEMETNGFLKGELSELASFPNLTKGTFGKVFNFPEAKESLFPLRFPRYLDRSPLEQITPVMFACMSIAFPKYIKEAFPDPSSLPRLMNGCMPVKMASSLSDRRTTGIIADAQLEDKKFKFLMETLEDCGDSHRSLPCTWNPNVPLGHMMTSNSVITRWVHDETSVTGPYNKWVELAVPEDCRDDTEEVSEADLKEKMFESLSQLDEQVFRDNDFKLPNVSGAEYNDLQLPNVSGAEYNYSTSSIQACSKPHSEQETNSNPSKDTPLSAEVKTLTGFTSQGTTCFEGCQVPNKDGLEVRKDDGSIDSCHPYTSSESGAQNNTENGLEKMTKPIPTDNTETVLPATEEPHSFVKLMAGQERSPPHGSFTDQITTRESPRHPVKHLVSLDVTSSSMAPGSCEQLVTTNLSSPASPGAVRENDGETNTQNVSSQQQSHTFESSKRQSMYDFLIHGFNRPFLSIGQFAGHEIHNTSTAVTNKERSESDSSNSEMK
ncbi:unnamed protein product [Lymnaea stagnalis]|uniref:methylcytosine dioxygenase n=1 Tax=Lymnaea stagnalis TaxID=6523 RepID=A0AAV2H4Y1_LYMST